MPNPKEHKRAIRSCVIRSGRMTASQQKAFDGHMAKWSLPFDETGSQYNFAQIFANEHPVTLEIGFGMGDSLATMAEASPQENFLGIEVHQAGVGRLLRLREEKQLGNLRVVCHDAVEVLKQFIPANSFVRVNIFFPDSW